MSFLLHKSVLAAGPQMLSASAAAAGFFFSVAELVGASLDPERETVHQRRRQLFPGRIVDHLDRGPGHLHIGAAFLLGEALPVDETDGFVFIHVKDNCRSAGRRPQRVEFLDPGQLTYFSAFSWSWYDIHLPI